MSYILEALKKAQAERQLGNAPTIHAPTLQTASAHPPGVKKTGLLALGAAVVVVAVLGGLFWSQRPPVPAVVLTAPPVLAALPASAPVAPAAPAMVTQAEPARATVARKTPLAPVATAVAPVAPAPEPAPAPEQENIRYARDLPQEIQQQLPRVRFGGYMYSDYAADRLVLVDKTLRHEGEEIAPGLVLEKLLPRGALLNFRGNRYRVNF